MNTFESPELKIDLKAPQGFGNLAEKLDETQRHELAEHVVELVNIDAASMSDWLGEANKHLDRVDSETNQSKPQGSDSAGSNEGSPPSTEITMSAVIQFTARITGAILSEPDLCRASEPGGEALAKWMSSQLRSVDQDWVTDTDPLTMHMAVTGLGWRKRWFDDHDQKFRSTWRTVNDIIVNANAKSLSRVPRITDKVQKYPYEVMRSIAMKHWVDYEPNFDDVDPQALQDFYETDIWLDLDGDGEDEPWTVTVALEDMRQVVKIVPRWTRKTVVDTEELLLFTPPRRYYAYKMIPDPKGKFLPKGFGWLLERIERSADRMLASIDDVAKSASENGGIAATGGVGLPEKIEIKNGQITTVNTDGRSIAEVLSLFPDKQVTPGMVGTLDKILTLGDRLAGTLNLLENAPASMTATMAKGIIDTGSQVQGAVHRRLIGEMTEEMRAFGVMADGMEQLPDGMVTGPIAVSADPNMSTEMHRGAIAQIYHEMLTLPMVFDVKEAATRYCETLRLPNPEKLVKIMGPTPPSQKDQVDAAIKLGKNAIDKMKAKGQVILQVAQAINALSQAGLNAQNAELAGVEIAKLNAAISELNNDATDAETKLAGMQGMEGQPGNGDPSASPPAAPGPGGVGVPVGPTGGPGGAGPGASAGPTLAPVGA
jgi:chaperonin GroES